ncbi:MAG TPA: dihydrofolate reductase [Phenylobacterium sp.]|jgi:dihydrofolate reductase|uniref:dihydrofolate reductase n=1 Tax=Phenylobacterium sp. TaxID=1871053 RepID=UPI002D657FE6|nr:dihydrofolate reductase [Phenylobacterium sp.]HZZ68797.1 dihydrofolate reductase [Phenylobacterium sp.]
MPQITLTAGPIALARNGVIGKDGGLPWRLKTDLANFRAVTMGKPVIMGRKTWESLPKKPLVGRTNIVLSRDGSFEPKGAVVCEDFAEAVSIAREQAEEDGAREVCVIGGASLFELALAKAGRVYLTDVDAEVEGDTVLPALDPARWTEVSAKAYPASEGDDYPFTIRVLERR